MELLVWIIFGAIVGWIASLILGRNEEQGFIANIFLGIAGALIGSLVSKSVGSKGVTGFDLSSFFIALCGAVILIGILNLLSGLHRS